MSVVTTLPFKVVFLSAFRLFSGLLLLLLDHLKDLLQCVTMVTLQFFFLAIRLFIVRIYKIVLLSGVWQLKMVFGFWSKNVVFGEILSSN